MKRREFIAGLGGTMAAWPLTALAQQKRKPTVIWFGVRPGAPPPEVVEAFRRGLAQAGFSEGRDVTIEYITADGRNERLSTLAADVVKPKADGDLRWGQRLGIGRQGGNADHTNHICGGSRSGRAWLGG
jgi:putative ABC transport system substrate-binding protein